MSNDEDNKATPEHRIADPESSTTPLAPPPASPDVTMAATHGRLERFDPSRPETWDAWADQFICYMDLNEIRDPKKPRLLLLSSCGTDTVRLVKSLLVPRTALESSFAEILDALNAYFSPRPAFLGRIQAQGEPTATFLAALRALAVDCLFLRVEDNLLTQFVWGLARNPVLYSVHVTLLPAVWSSAESSMLEP